MLRTAIAFYFGLTSCVLAQQAVEPANKVGRSPIPEKIAPPLQPRDPVAQLKTIERRVPRADLQATNPKALQSRDVSLSETRRRTAR